uniref:START domain-containing protein n=1 Tax=Mesocestoides corti TaxID=53468 RepID=A0A5K3FSD5_MESCO
SEPSSEWLQPGLNDKPKTSLLHAIVDLLCVFGKDLHLPQATWPKHPEVVSRDAKLGAEIPVTDETTDATRKYSSKRFLPELGETVTENWVSITSDFININIMNNSHMSSECVYVANKSLGSDHMIMHMFPASMTRMELFNLVRRSLNGHSVDCTRYGVAVPIKAFRLSMDKATSQIPFMWSIMESHSKE